MSLPACRSSGVLTASALVVTGQCKLVSIHGVNIHATDASTATLYDNTAASCKKVAVFALPAMKGATSVETTGGSGSQNIIGSTPTLFSLEWDMHGVICHNGLYVDVTNGTPHLTIEYA